VSSPVEKSFMAKFEAKLAEQPGENEEFDLFASENKEERVEREKAVEDRRLAVARKEQEKQEAYEKRRAAYERGETEPVTVDADTLKKAVAAVGTNVGTPLVALADALGISLMSGNREHLASEELGEGNWEGAITTGYNISQRHYADNGNKRFGTASALLCLAKAGVHPSDEQITKLANLLNDVLDEECSVKEAADKMS
jgi:hypothetical protein